MDKSSLNFVVMVKLKNDLDDKFLSLIRNFVSAIKLEDGCLDCECLKTSNDGKMILFQESWNSISQASETQIAQLHIDYLVEMAKGAILQQDFEVSTWFLASDIPPKFRNSENHFSFLLERTAKKGREKEIRLLFEKIIDISMIETECLSYCLYINSLGEMDKFLLLGTWLDKNSWQRHHHAEYMQNFIFCEELSLIMNVQKPTIKEVQRVL
ncbi:antibiotic biosynthesis monooxygenase [Lentisphaerota bacterium WC36G]|nr:hypothetical protein LJT99_06545 [Lentisphaerae bacterium WC36]